MLLWFDRPSEKRQKTQANIIATPAQSGGTAVPIKIVSADGPFLLQLI